MIGGSQITKLIRHSAQNSMITQWKSPRASNTAKPLIERGSGRPPGTAIENKHLAGAERPLERPWLLRGYMYRLPLTCRLSLRCSRPSPTAHLKDSTAGGQDGVVPCSCGRARVRPAVIWAGRNADVLVYILIYS